VIVTILSYKYSGRRNGIATALGNALTPGGMSVY
jgi:hypothetical protein